MKSVRARALGCWLLAAAVSACAAPAAPAGPLDRVTVTHRTEVELDLRVLRRTPDGADTIFQETLEGVAGESLTLEENVLIGTTELVTRLVFVCSEDQGTGSLPVRLHARIDDPVSGRPLARVERTLKLADGRLRLVDLWSAGGPGQRLVLALSARWKEVPEVVPVRADVLPVDLVVEVLRSRQGRSPELLERHRLSTLVGSEVGYTFVQQAPVGRSSRESEGADPADGGPSPGQFEIEVLPDSVRDDEVSLSISIRQRGRNIYSDVPAVDLRVRHEVAPGLSVDVPLPGTQEGGGLLFRITPYF